MFEIVKKKELACKNVLVINPFGIGDVLFTTPLLARLRSLLPNGAKITFLCNRRAEPILESNDAINKVVVFEKDEYRKLWKESKIRFCKVFASFVYHIYNQKFDAVFDISLGRQYSFWCMLLKIPMRVGFNYRNRGRFLTHKINIGGFTEKPIPEYYLDLLRLFNVTVNAASLSFPLKEEVLRQADIFLEENMLLNAPGIVGIMPGGGESWGKDAYYKRWTPSYFAQVADYIVKKYGYTPILFGSRSEESICKDVLRHMASKGIIVTDLALSVFAAVLKKCSFVICNDGGPLHIAVSQGVPTVSIFGPVNEGVYGPYPASDKDVIVKNNVSCRPCYYQFRYKDCDTHTCLRDLLPQHVTKEVDILVDRI
ncbi:MAG: glycosyltransferase family 9 protein [Candidatus Ancaeobacter aquaticus]|nr:glycosyltransferase family 9 protein [Candidatus Ancaeobacter aquaticus]